MSRTRCAPALARSASVVAFSTFFVSATIASAQDAVPPAPPQDAASAAATQGAAQPTGEGQSTEIVVSGVRASLERSMDLKRNSTGVVDGISAEDIGKFPDTNVAESLQRVAGVSIDRVNGEGAQVTVRGFGPGYNLVTLNGRTLPTASIPVIGQDQAGDGAQGTTRSFDFANIASEGVSRLEVYKTARASVTSGGIGAAINVVTRRPLDGESGLTGTISAKADYDSTDTIYDRVTPEVSGLLNWANPDETLGVSLFGSWQRRNNSAASVTVNDWNVMTYDEFIGSVGTLVTPTTVIQNAPANGSELIAFPSDSRYEYSEFQRERINAQGDIEFRPSDSLTINIDGTFYQNRSKELRTDQANWLNRPFNEVDFDGNPQVATATYIDDVIGGVKDGGFEQQYRAVKERMWDAGANLKWEATDNLSLVLDAHTSKAQALPDNPLGHTSTAVSIASHGIADQQLAIVNGFPQQTIEFNDDPANGGDGNANGMLDLGDLGSQVARSWTSKQSQRVNEIRVDGAWEMGDDDRVQFGASYRDNKMHETQISTYQTLGDWGVANVGDVQQFAGDLVDTFCLTCKFTHFDPGSTGDSLVAFRGDATQLWTALGSQYPGFGSDSLINGNANNIVREKVWAAYAQVDLNGTMLGRPWNIVAGVRYEHTDSTSTSVIQIPQTVVWQADNDFGTSLSADYQPNSVKNSYDHILPALDFSVDITDTLKGRVSYGKTIARPDFASLFSNVSIGDHTPNRPTAIGGIATATSGNPLLVPLVSDNFDASLEWYFKPSSFVSVGFFDKRVRNFVGIGQENQSEFGLTDPSSGATGTRSGDALNYLRSIGANLSDVNYFTMTALVDQVGLAAAEAQFQAHYSGGNLDQAFVDSILASYDVLGNADDPLMIYQVKQPVNNKEGHLWGAELQGQYFLGNSGFGVTAAYTLVRGDVNFDIMVDPTDPEAAQFALLGLSDTFNGSLIYEKYGISARVTYNWRDKYLSSSRRGGYSNPTFVAPYHQIDFNVSYDITPNIAVSIEGINVTKEDVKQYARTKNEPWFIVQGASRYLLGVRYKF
jgi:TonB-dependent receptor